MWRRCCYIKEEKKQQKRQYDMKYAKSHLKRIPLDVPKASYDEIKAHAAGQGETVNGFIKRAITETMERDQAQPIGASAQHESAEESTEPKSFIERVLQDVEQIVVETDKNTEEEDFAEWKKHNRW
jgi:hypothetical protein